MSEGGDRAKLEFVLSLISDIEEIIRRHIAVNAALDDIEGRHALLMCLMQIGEKLNQLRDGPTRDRLPVYGAYSVRNIIAYDYGIVNDAIVESVLTDDIPELKKSIENLLSGKA